MNYHNYENNEKYVNMILPNLVYNNNKIYCKTNRCVHIYNNNIKKLENLFDTGIDFTAININLFGNYINCNIKNIEDERGLCIEIKYFNNNNIFEKHLQKIGKYIEGTLLRLDLSNIDDFNDENAFYERRCIDINSDENNSFDNSFDNNYDNCNNYDSYDEYSDDTY